MKQCLLWLMACLASLWVGNAEAQGQSQSSVQASNWSTQCSSISRDVPLDCTGTAIAFVTATHQRLLEVRLRTKTGQAEALTIVGPFGISTLEPMSVGVDGKPITSAAIFKCEQDGCYANVELTPDLRAAMQKGKELDIGFAQVSGNRVTVPLPLNGFSAAYQSISVSVN